MRSIAISPTTTGISREGSDISYRRRHRLWMTNLLVTSIAAAISAIFGLALAAASLLHFISSRSSLGIAGTILLALTFPLLVFAAHCLDKIDSANREYRLASYRRKIFGETEADNDVDGKSFR